MGSYIHIVFDFKVSKAHVSKFCIHFTNESHFTKSCKLNKICLVETEKKIYPTLIDIFHFPTQSAKNLYCLACSNFLTNLMIIKSH